MMRVLSRLTSTFRDLMKHSFVYGAGNLASRALSIVLLPIYTRYLSPTDYGYIALLDLATATFSLLVGGGIANAVARFHFDSDRADHHRAVWWTGVSIVVLSSMILLTPAWIARGALADLVLGPDVEQGGLYFALVLPMVAFNILNLLLLRYLQIRKWSGLFATLSLSRLALNASLNLFFLIHLDLGVTGILLGNLLTGCVVCLVLLGVLVYSLGAFVFERGLLGELTSFGLPFVGTGLLVMVMHQADRYLLRVFEGPDAVGIYSIAYTLGQGLSDIVITAFGAIWGVVIYEIAKQANREQVYADVFGYFSTGLALVLFGLALFARPVVNLLTGPQFHGAASLVPIVCLAYFFFGLHIHFIVPALLAKRSRLLLPPAIAGGLTNIALNLVLIPRFGATGAAWASVGTFLIYSLGALWLNRKLERFPYRLGIVCLMVLGMMLSFLAVEQLHLGRWLDASVRGLVWAGWAVGLGAHSFRALLGAR